MDKGHLPVLRFAEVTEGAHSKVTVALLHISWTHLKLLWVLEINLASE